MEIHCGSCRRYFIPSLKRNGELRKICDKCRLKNSNEYVLIKQIRNQINSSLDPDLEINISDEYTMIQPESKSKTPRRSTAGVSRKPRVTKPKEIEEVNV